KSSPETETVAAPSETTADTPADTLAADSAPNTPAAVSTPYRNIVPIIKGEVSLMEPNQRVRIAAIGTGNIFRGAHLPAYPDIPQAQLVAFCDPDKEAQKAVYQRYKSLVEAKIKQAIERDDQSTADR